MRAREIRAFCRAGKRAVLVGFRRRAGIFLIVHCHRFARPAAQPLLFDFRQEDKPLALDFNPLAVLRAGCGGETLLVVVLQAFQDERCDIVW